MPQLPLCQFRATQGLLDAVSARAKLEGVTVGEVVRAALGVYLRVEVHPLGRGLGAASIDPEVKRDIQSAGGRAGKIQPNGKKSSIGKTNSTKDLRRRAGKSRKK